MTGSLKLVSEFGISSEWLFYQYNPFIQWLNVQELILEY